MSLDSIEFREVDRSRWDYFERLFEARGGPKYCWCMVWRRRPRGASRSDAQAKNQAKKDAIHGLVESGTQVGILGYLDDEPIAWCSIAPRDSYRNLGGPDDLGDGSESVWSIVCFFVPRRLRGQGMMRQLIEAAVDHAREKGATVVEAYPVDPTSPSYRFMGFVGTFESMGFREVGRAGTRRHVMRLSL